MNKPLTTFAQNLNQKGISIQEFCEITKVKQITAYKWASGENKAPTLALWALDVIGTHSSLFFDEGQL
jgi:hypothetical protein